jgi:hypothetical protein
MYMKALSLALFAIIAFGFSIHPNALKLEYVFKVGDQYVMSQNTQQVLSQTIMGTEQKGGNEYVADMALKVQEITLDGAKIEAQFLKLRIRSVTLMGEIAMNSEGDVEQVQNKMVKAVMKKPFTLTANKFGQIVNVEGAENLWADYASMNLDEQSVGPAKQLLKQFTDSKTLKSNIEQSMVHYSENKVEEGDKWSSKIELPNFPIKVDNSWSLINVKSGIANVNADGIFTTLDKDKTIELPNGFKAKVDLNGAQQMKSTVNVKTGWANDLLIHAVMKGKMTLLAGGMLPLDVDVPMEITTDTSYKTTKK